MILLLGGSGYVGHAFQQLFARLGLEYRNLARQELDYADPRRLADFLADARPEFVVNAAGYTGKPNVDACEDDKANTLFGNAVLPGNIRAACERAGVPWGHVSSGCIYSGRRADGGGFKEEDFPNFSFRSNRCSFYSGTKALGEEILAGAENLYVWRLRIPFNEIDSPRNYLTKLMRYARLLDAENSISQLDEFVAACFACWQQRVPFGTYNVTNPGFVTTREVAAMIRASGVCKKEFEFFSDETEFMAKAAKTLRSNCVMDSSKLASVGIELTEVHAAVERALREWRSE
ncbi:MAG: sugar nucleotide-binding protein [Verrucomicrobia bacterium]|nr:sugar nucleotide-binding protein [Verrucomicrobiota bacterium]